ncbi:SHOCT domain-containing protein [Clostridium beijerinckii]|uniref:SHOCT domain-containing protein n=1 Tax=Clostridium beijerinckii TaxID=1520 RepID=UPI000478DFAB|nr:SHOCT domain-containing protein [Clostridium beijerinckii]
MSKRGRVKPNKSISIIGMVAGAGMTYIGITQAIPDTGAFGVVWTLVAIGIGVANAINVFSENGVASFQIDVEDNESDEGKYKNFDEKLRKIKGLKEDGIISEEEYEAKRKEILNEKW